MVLAAVAGQRGPERLLDLALRAGPYGDRTGGAILFQAENESDVEALIAGDPYTRLNVTKDRFLREWRVTVGSVVQSG